MAIGVVNDYGMHADDSFWEDCGEVEAQTASGIEVSSLARGNKIARKEKFGLDFWGDHFGFEGLKKGWE